MRDSRHDRALPVFVTLLVVAFLTLTFDIRSEGEGLLGSIRAGANRLLAPVQELGTVIANPVADLVENLSDIAGLRAENEALKKRLAEAQADAAATEDLLDRLATLERLHKLELDIDELVRTDANVIGRTDSLDLTFRIDKGEESGVLPGHPVLDEYGYLVGRVGQAWNGGATVVPLIGDVESVTVKVGDQIGTLSAVVGSGEMELVLEVFETAKPVFRGDRVVTSSRSRVFPPSLPVGEIIEDAEPQGQVLNGLVRPFSDHERLRVVAVVAWPPDPAAVAADDEMAEEEVDPAETSTTVPGEEVGAE